MSIRAAFGHAVRAIGVLAIASSVAARPLHAQNSSTLSVTFSGFATPTGADFAAGEIRGTVSYTITCGSNRTNCEVTMAGANASVTEPANTTAVTNLQYSLNNGVSWTTLTNSPVTLVASAPSGNTNGSLLVRYRLGWQSGGNPYTPPGTYSFPVAFTIQQGQP